MTPVHVSERLTLLVPDPPSARSGSEADATSPARASLRRTVALVKLMAALRGTSAVACLEDIVEREARRMCGSCGPP